MSEIDNDLNEMTSKWKREMILSEIRQWSSAEQGVLIADALKMVSINLVKFISIICDDLISKSSNTSEGDPSYINFMEDQANDISYFRVLDEKSTEKKLKHLNMYLPLLRMLSNNRSQNETLKDSYNNLIQNVLEECVFEKKFFTECRDVLLFACMHPIFDNIQKLSFQKWFELIDKSSTDSDQLPTSNLSNHDVNEQHEGKSRKLNVEISSSINAFEKTKTIVTMRKNLFLEKANSSPIESTDSNFDSKALKISNVMNSLENIQTDLADWNENTRKPPIEFSTSNKNPNNLQNNNPGMKNITQWLKNIKLHKYTEFFIQMSYDDLLTLNDEILISAHITLGARKKILACISKLRERPDRLKQLIQILEHMKCPMNNSTLENILIELSEISMSPIEPNSYVPSSAVGLQNNFSNDLNFKASENTCHLILDLLTKIQRYLLHESKHEINLNIEHKKELLKTCKKIIDKLFLTRAFSDIQNVQMSKLRTCFNEAIKNIDPSSQSQVSRKASYNSHAILKKSSSSNAPFSNVSNNANGFSELNEHRGFSALSTQPSQNSINARQRIQNKSKALSKTMSAPYNFKEPVYNQSQENQLKSNSFFESDDRVS